MNNIASHGGSGRGQGRKKMDNKKKSLAIRIRTKTAELLEDSVSKNKSEAVLTAVLAVINENKPIIRRKFGRGVETKSICVKISDEDREIIKEYCSKIDCSMNVLFDESIHLSM